MPTRNDTIDRAETPAELATDLNATMFRGFTEQWEQGLNMWATLWSPTRGDQQRVRNTNDRLGDSLRELASAQQDFLGELLRMPFWMTGASSPSDLQQRFMRVADAQREVWLAQLESLLGWQRSMVGRTERVAEEAREATETAVENVGRATEEVARAQETAVKDARGTVLTTNGVTRELREIAADTVREARKAAKASTKAASAATKPAKAKGPVKGNINAQGEKIFFQPGDSNYTTVQPERTFATKAQAKAAGYRPVKRARA